MSEKKLRADINKAIRTALALDREGKVKVETKVDIPGTRNQYTNKEDYALFKIVYQQVDKRKEGGIEAYLDWSGVYIRKLKK